MSRKYGVWVVLAVTLVLARPAGAASLVNFGFETGDFTGWTLGGPAAIRTTHTGDLGTLYGPVEGDYFAGLAAGAGNVYQTLSQDFSAQTGESLHGYAAFDFRDYSPFDDDAYVKLRDGSGTVIDTPWFVSGASVPNHDDGPWTLWSWTAPSDGTFTLEYGVRNRSDSVNSSAALFDAAPVPEPLSLFLFGSGILGGSLLRRKTVSS